MRRQSLACHRAVQSLQSPTPQHIWISDELLSHALRRFFLTSCPQQKRHGSHVPGPLEARRRASKRRMTVSANFNPPESWPTSFNLSELFGFRPGWKPTWRYEPPTRRTEAQTTQPLEREGNMERMEGEPAMLKFASSSVSRVEVESVPQAASYPAIPINASHTIEYSPAPYPIPINNLEVHRTQIKPPNSAELEPEDAQDESPRIDCTASFQAFRLQLVEANTVSKEEYGHILLEAYEAHYPRSSDPWVFNTMVMEHLVEVRQDPTSLLKSLQKQHLAIPAMIAPRTQKFFLALEALRSLFPDCSPYLHHVYLRLAESIASASASKTHAQDAILLTVLRDLVCIAPTQPLSENPAINRLVYMVARKLRVCSESRPLKRYHLMQHLVDEAEQTVQLIPVIQAVLQCLPKTVLPDLISDVTYRLAGHASYNAQSAKNSLSQFDVWLRSLHRPEFKDLDSDTNWLQQAITALARSTFSHHRAIGHRFPSLLHGVIIQTQPWDNRKEIPPTRIIELLMPDQDSIVKPRDQFPVNTVLDLLVSRMYMAGLPHQRLVEHLVNISANHANFQQLLRILNVLQKRNISMQRPTLLIRRIKLQMSAVNPHLGGKTSTQQRDASTLRLGRNILAVIDRVSSNRDTTSTSQLERIHAQQQFQQIFENARLNHGLPLNAKGLAADMPPPDRVGFIHQLAYQYSMDITRSQREVWRSMNTLYRFLREHNLPIGPLFTRAVVRTCLARPLLEHRFVSAWRLKWVLNLVEQIEGKNVASKIESIFWQWRGDLIKHSKGVHDSAGGDRREKASTGMIKRLKMM